MSRVRAKITEYRRSQRRWANWYLDFIASLVPGPLGWRIRRLAFRKRVLMGRGATIDELVRIDYPERLVVGIGSFIGRGTFIQASGEVEIGANVLIAPYVKIWSSDHSFDGPGLIRQQGHRFAKVTIGDDVWIGTGAIILRGVRVGTGAIIGAGSVVTRDVDQYTIVAGNPARTVRCRRREPTRD